MNMEHHYSSSIRHKKVAIFGIMPPPLGGVSVHIQRVTDILWTQGNRVVFFATEQRIRKIFPLYLGKVVVWLIRNRPQVLYYHSSYLKTCIFELFVLLVLRFFLRYELAIVDHDCRHLYQRGAWYKKLYRWIARKVNQVVCIGENTYTSYQDNEIEPSTVSIEAGFIPPIKRTTAAIWGTYPSSLTIFMQEHTPLLLVSAAHLMLIDGKDVYGVDTTITMLSQIKREYPDIGLIIGLAQIKDNHYFAKLQQLMKVCEVAEHIFILHGNKELWPLFEQVDLFLRPTLSDGDSIAVREALYFKVPVVASSICTRPHQVSLYNVSDDKAYSNTVTTVVQEYVYGAARKCNNLHQKSS